MSDTNRKAALCVIGARGGSKGLPGKNIRPLCGLPLIAHTLSHALDSRCFDAVAVSSDAEDILACAKQHGATYCIKRPEALASDTASVLDMIRHAVDEVEKQSAMRYDVIALLQPTSPCRAVEDVQKAFNLLKNNQASTVLSATPSEKSPYSTILERDAISRQWRTCVMPSTTIERRQDAPATYDLNGAIYLWQRAAFDKTPQPLQEGTELYIMPKERSIDIDTALDFQIAEHILNEKR